MLTTYSRQSRSAHYTLCLVLSSPPMARRTRNGKCLRRVANCGRILRSHARQPVTAQHLQNARTHHQCILALPLALAQGIAPLVLYRIASSHPQFTWSVDRSFQTHVILLFGNACHAPTAMRAAVVLVTGQCIAATLTQVVKFLFTTHVSSFMPSAQLQRTLSALILVRLSAGSRSWPTVNRVLRMANRDTLV